MRRHLSCAAALVTSLLLATSGCGESDGERATKSSSTTAPSATPAAAPTGSNVTIQSFKYLPPSISTTVGAKLTFKNADNAEHTATAEMKSAFDTGTVTNGQTKTITLTRAGTFAYRCEFHPFMHGTVVIKGGARQAQAKPTARTSRQAPAKAAPSGATGDAKNGRSAGVEGGSGGY